jgi:hypothetical protein
LDLAFRQEKEWESSVLCLLVKDPRLYTWNAIGESEIIVNNLLLVILIGYAIFDIAIRFLALPENHHLVPIVA